MKNAITIAIVTLLILSGCGGGKQSADGLITVDVTASYPEKELILQDMFDVEYISLETTDEFITAANMRAIGKNVMIFTNMDPWNGDIFIFDRAGKGLRKIDRSGLGSEEYLNIQSIVLDEDNNEMYINSSFSNKIFVYDLFGNFKKSIPYYRDNLLFNLTGNFDQDNMICHDVYYRVVNKSIIAEKRNFFMLVSKQDGSIKEIPIPYKEKILMMVFARDANGKIINDRGIRHRELVPYQNGWILTEASADTIYHYLPDHTMKPFITRTPSVQSMEPEVFLFPGVITDRYYFMQTVKKDYDFVADDGFPCVDLVYDVQEKSIFECVVYNDDYTNKRPMSLVYEYPMFAFGNDEIALMKRLEAFELAEAYEKGQLKDGKLKEIASTLNEEDNAVIMLIKHRK